MRSPEDKSQKPEAGKNSWADSDQQRYEPPGGIDTSFYRGTTPEITEEVAKELLNYDVTHYTGGISNYHCALDMSRWDDLEVWINEQAEIAHKNRWRYFEDEDGNPYALNEDNNKFTPEQIETSPIRMLYCINSEGMEGHDPTPPEFAKIFRDWEDTIYKCVLNYTDKYPYVVNCLWWRTRGHFMKYVTSGFLGPHADCDSNYRTRDGQRYLPMSEFPTRQTISISANLSQCGRDYKGGVLRFPYYDIDIDMDAGDVVMFPANFMGMHELTTVTEGERHAYLVAFGSGTDGKTQPDVSEPEWANMWTPPIWLNDVHDDYAKVIRHSPIWAKEPLFYNPVGQNRPLEGVGVDKAGGGHFDDNDPFLVERASDMTEAPGTMPQQLPVPQRLGVLPRAESMKGKQ